MGDTQPRRLEEFLAREVLLIFTLVLLALVQVTLLPTPLGFPPALLLVLVVCRILVRVGESHPEENFDGVMRWAFYGGVALDLLSATPLGSHALALLLAAILVAIITRRMRVEGLLLPLFLMLIGAVVYEITLALVYSSSTMTMIDWRSYASVVIFPSVMSALILTLPLFLLLRRLSRTNT